MKKEKDKKNKLPPTLDAIMLSEIDAVVNAIGDDDDTDDQDVNDTIFQQDKPEPLADKAFSVNMSEDEKKAFRAERIKALKQLVDTPKVIGNGDITPFAWKHKLKIPEKRASKILKALAKEELAREQLLPAKAQN